MNLPITFYISCKKEGNNPKVIDPVSLKKDSIYNTLGVNVDNVEGLTNLKVKYTDSLKNQYILGKRNNKSWIGVFSQTGHQLQEKTFLNDPDTVYTGFGKYKEVNNIQIHRPYETGRFVILPRVLYSSEEGIDLPLVQSLAVFDKLENRFIKYFYNKLSSETDIYWASFIRDWHDKIIIQYTAGLYGKDSAFFEIYNTSWDLVDRIERKDYPAIGNITNFNRQFPLSDLKYLEVDHLTISKKDLRQSDKYLWQTKVLEDVPENSIVEIINSSVDQVKGVFTFRITNWNNTVVTKVISLDIKTGSTI